MFIPFEQIVRPLAWSLGLTTFFLIALRLILGGWRRAVAICSMILVSFYSFGHVTIAVQEWASRGSNSFQVSHLAWAWLGAFLLFSYLLLSRGLAYRIHPYLNVASGALILFPLVGLFSVVWTLKSNEQAGEAILADLRGESEAEIPMRTPASSEVPDIDYITKINSKTLSLWLTCINAKRKAIAP